MNSGHNIVPELKALAEVNARDLTSEQLVKLHSLPPAHLSLVIAYAERTVPPNTSISEACGSIALARLCLLDDESLYRDDVARDTLRSIANTGYPGFDVHGVR